MNRLIMSLKVFCRQYPFLRERPVEAVLDPGFEELDDRDDALLLEQAWNDYLASVQEDRPELLAGLKDLDVDAQDLKDYYKVLSAYPDVEAARDLTSFPDLAAARRDLDELLDWVEGVLPGQEPDGGWDDLQKLLRTSLRRRRSKAFDLDNNVTFLGLLSDLKRSVKSTQKKWRNRDDAKQADKRFEAFKGGALAQALRQWQEYRHAGLMEFILSAIDYYTNLKRKKSRLNYQDLLMSAATLLRLNPEVRDHFQGRYTHLLVDEFQDTDPIQAEVVFYLTGQDHYEQDWRKLQPRSGSLFVVGDPKQSIYRFRRADIDTYNEVKHLIVASGGTMLPLTTNFRSLDVLGEWANPVFQTLLAREAIGFQAAFEGLDTVRTADEGCCCGLRKITIPKVTRDSAGEIAKKDAERIAGWVSYALSGGIRLSRTDEERLAGLTERPVPGDFLILTRKKKWMEIYASALESRGIPYRIAGGEGFFQSPELLDLLKLLRSLLDPGNPVALVAVLRSSLFGVSDGQLYLFKRAGGCFDIYSEIPDELEAGDRECFGWAFAELRQFRAWIQDLPLSAALDAIMSTLGSVPAAGVGDLLAGVVRDTWCNALNC